MAKLKRYTAEVTFTYDPAADAAYIYLATRETVRKTVHGKTYEAKGYLGRGHTGIYIDVAKGGAVIGIELLGSELLPEAMRKLVGLK